MSCSLDEVIQAIHAAEQGGFPAPGRPNERRHLVLWNIQVDLEQRLNRSIIKVKSLYPELRFS